MGKQPRQWLRQMNSTTPFRLPRFYPILDTRTLAARGCDVTVAAEALLDAGVTILQYRHKDDWLQKHFDQARHLASLCQDAGVLFVLNDRADFAKLLKSALHLGQEDLPPVAARLIISDEVMGFSTHNAAQLNRGDAEPVEYLSVGPIFSTASKRRPDPVVGIDGLKSLRELTKKPLCAIGGVTLSNVDEVFAVKADSAAVISGILPAACDRKALKAKTAEWLAAVGR
jgi:thiamine-phosphate pyrophosphorylase